MRKATTSNSMMYHVENNIIKTDHKPLDDRYEGGAGYFCFKYMKKHGENIAQINVSTGEKETYDALLTRCIRTSIMLREMGVNRGDIITFCSKTNLNSCVPLIASFLIGAIPSYVDGTMDVYDITRFISCIKPKMFLVTPDLIHTVQDLTINTHSNVDVVAFDDEFFKAQREESDFTPVYVEDIQETAIILFSSGTTGFPKGICINHYRLVCCKAFSLENLWVEGEMKTVFSYDSFHWSVENVRLFCSIREGVCRLISSDEDDMKKTWNILENYKVNIAYFIPWLLMDIIVRGKPNEVNLDSLTTVFVEGSLLPAKYHEELQKLLPKADVFIVYGTTETGRLTTFRKIDIHRQYNRTKLACVGVPVIDFGVSLKVVDLDNGKAVGRNQKGELRVKSRAVMNGYHNLDSSDQFDDDGFFKTGDITYYNEDLCFFVLDRIKDLILFQGLHIVPAALESELLSHPAVKAAAVVGVPHEIDTEHPLGLVVLHDIFNDTTPKEIEKYVEDRVPDRHRLRGGVRIVKESILKTGNKMQRYKLKQLVISGKI